MSLRLNGREVKSVLIVDDSPDARVSLSYAIEDLGLEPVSVSKGPSSSLNTFAEYVAETGEAVICDHHLQKRRYANFSGAATAAALYQRNIPTVLYTRFREIIAEIQPYRRFIPVLLNPEKVNPVSLEAAFRQCAEEFNGRFRPSRQSWRTLIRIEDVNLERKLLHVVIPAWDPAQVIPLPFESIPSNLRADIVEGEDDQTRFFARVNIGAESYEELYFEEWEA